MSKIPGDRSLAWLQERARVVKKKIEEAPQGDPLLYGYKVELREVQADIKNKTIQVAKFQIKL